jgi:predicted O-methyltransferase YrrM
MTGDEILEISRSFQRSCVLLAAVDLDLFSVLGPRSRTARELAADLGADARGIEVLLDALVSLGLLSKQGGEYSVPEGVAPLLGRHGPGSILAMAQHQANCLRRWAQLAKVVKTGRPAERAPSIRGEDADRAAFIGAMDNISGPMADGLVRELDSIQFRHLLDVGGASGTWTIAFLRARPAGEATLFDLPEVIPLAERHLKDVGLKDRVRLVAGDFLEDPLPRGADLAWVSAIVHQNSRKQNRLLFGRIFEVLETGGSILLRDIVMDPDRTSPPQGALFAVNMLVGTEGGGTFTFAELREDLEAAGFSEVALLRRDQGMNSIVLGKKGRPR